LAATSLALCFEKPGKRDKEQREEGKKPGRVEGGENKGKLP